LADEQSLNLLILKELIANMTGIEAVEDYSDAQLEGQAGSATLQAETATNRTVKNKKRSCSLLMDGLKRRNLIFPFFVLMAQQKKYVLTTLRSFVHF
jgi:hypothetical protein